MFRKNPDVMGLLVGLLLVSIGVGTMFGAGWGWLTAGAAFVVASYIS